MCKCYFANHSLNDTLDYVKLDMNMILTRIGPSGVRVLPLGVAAERSVHYFCDYCHSPTQPQLELLLDFKMGRKPPTTPPPPPGTFKALPDNLGS